MRAPERCLAQIQTEETPRSLARSAQLITEFRAARSGTLLLLSLPTQIADVSALGN